MNIRDCAIMEKTVKTKYLYVAVLQILKNKGLVRPGTKMRFDEANGDFGEIEVYAKRNIIVLRDRTFNAFAKLIFISEMTGMDDADVVETGKYYPALLETEILAVLKRNTVSL